jgi:two-component system LytT family sensor kinase
LRWGVHSIFKERNTFFLLEGDPHLTPAKFLLSGVFTLFCVSLPIRVWSSFRAERQLEIQRARLVEARLAALTNQINPHFLFNTLNSVSSLIRIDPERARGVVYKLSSILRRLLRKTDNMSPLREEISFIDDYLAIEMTRFGDKLRFRKQIADDTLDRLVPSMILQPVIENSIKHGLAPKIEGGSIQLRTWLDSGSLHICIEDDGVGIAADRIQHIYQDGIGVSNVNERLRVLYGSRYRMSVDSEPGQGTKTEFVLPV